MSSKIPNLWIIDDDPMSSFYIKRLAELGELAHIISIYNTAEGAINYLLHHKKSPEHLPDIILLDIYMPEVDGWEFLKQLEKIEAQLAKKPAVYIISSSSHPRDLDRAAALPIVRHYFQKPVTLEVLKSVVQEVIDER
jgi:DNA-binding NarL/FixJ family response regulator